MLIDPTWVDGPDGMLMLMPVCRKNDSAAHRLADAYTRGYGVFATVWASDDGDGASLDAVDLPTLDEAKAWCMQRLREFGHTFVGDPTVLELAERIAVLEPLVYSMQMRGGR